MSDEACYADDIGDYRWEGFPLEQKVAWMQNAQGSAAVQPGVDALRGLSAHYAESHRTVQAGLAELGVTWQGQSADAAGHAVTRLADWVGGAGQTVSGGGGSMGTYGASFDAMKPRINPPAPIPAVPSVGPKYQPADGVGVLAGLRSAIRQQADATAAADAQANAALRAHQQATRAALGSFPLVEPPPQVTAGATAPAGATNGGVVLSQGTVPRSGGAGAARGGARPAVGFPSAGGAAGSAGGAAAGSAGRTGTGSVGAWAGSGGSGGAEQHGDITGAGQLGATPGAGGTTTAGAGAPASTADAGGWTPPRPAPTGGGPVSGPNGGPVPESIPPPYQGIPGSGGPTGPDRNAGAGGGGGGARGGYAEGHGPPPLAPRTGGGAVRPQFGGDFGVPQSAPGRATGSAGGTPMGMGGGARAGEERAHRNRTFIPSDEPFRVEFCDATPPVLGVRDEEAW